MWRSFTVLALLVLSHVGCRVCDHPYDYDGPVVPCGTTGGCSTCGHGHGEIINEGEVQESYPQHLRPSPAPLEIIPGGTSQRTTKENAYTSSYVQAKPMPNHRNNTAYPLQNTPQPQSSNRLTRGKGPIIW